MTAQKTPLKTKAKTLFDWQMDCTKPSDNFIDLVLLSDAEPLEAEIQQLNTQIETAKQRLEEEKEFLVYRTPLVQDLKKILGEKTEV